jgi:hypothetical protein
MTSGNTLRIDAGTTDTPNPAATRLSIELICGAACCPMIGLKPAFLHADTMASAE